METNSLYWSYSHFWCFVLLIACVHYSFFLCHQFASPTFYRLELKCNRSLSSKCNEPAPLIFRKHAMKARLSQQDVPQDAVALDMAFLDCSHSKLNSSRATKAPAKRKEETKLPVRTEFVFTSHVDCKTVSLCGDWCNWQPIQMTLEQERVWSVITVTPSGYREFCYVADGRLTVSPKHPTNIEGTRNWRMVYGPPASRRSQVERLPWLEKRMDKLADSVRAALISTFRKEGKRQREITAEGDVEHGITAASLPGKQSCGRVFRGWSSLKVVLVCFAVFSVVIGILRARQVLR